MEELIIAGRITVNRMPADVGQKVGPGDEVRINGEPVKIRFAEPKPRVLLYHKPTGELVTRDDPEDRPTVFEDLPSIRDGKWIAVGRLDYNTEGLLIFTNSGELANRLMHPRYEVEREYAVRVMGRLTDEQTHALLTGIELEDGPAKCEKVEDGGGEEESANHWYNVSLKEGRNREVRRLFEALGLAVSRLIRVRYGRIAMPSSLKRGDVLELEPNDVNALLRSIGLKANAGGTQAAEGDSQGPPRQHGPQDRPQGQPHGKGQRPGQRGRRRGPPNAAGQGNVQRNGPGNGNREAQGASGAQRGSQGNQPRPAHGKTNRGSPGNAQRPGQGGGPRPQGQPQGNAKRRGQRQGQGYPQGNAPGGGQRRPPRHAQGDAQGNVLGGSPGRPGKQKRRGGRGAKSSSNVSAQVGVARDRRVGHKPPGAEGRVPSMPIVIHKKSRRGSLPNAEGHAPVGNGLPRGEEEAG
jgi:23S rRNA pseudouridine2605 synthase